MVTETNGNEEVFSYSFLPTRFASGYDQNRLIISDVSRENKHRVAPKLMIIVPK